MAFQKIYQGNRHTNNYSEYVADTPEDVKKIQISSTGANMGSEVYVISIRKTYVLDSKYTWHPKGTEGEVIECDCIEEQTVWEDLPNPTK